MCKQPGIIIVIVMFLMILSQGLSAQDGRGNGRVGGTVKDKDGNPIPDVKISLKILTGVSSGARKMLGDTLSTSFEAQGKSTENVENGFQLDVMSDKKGRWGLIGFATGEFKLVVEKEGYAPMEQMVRLTQMRRNPLIQIVLVKPEQTPEAKKENPSGGGLKMGNALFTEGRYEEALPYFQEYVKKNPDQFKMGINLGNCYMVLKKYDEAIKTFEAVIDGYKKENPNLKGIEQVATIYASIGEAYSNLEDLEQASAFYKKSMEVLPPTDAAVAYNAAEILFNGGKTGEAIEYYSLASKLKPEAALYYAKLGYAYLNKGNIPEALSCFEKFVKLAPDDPQTPTLNALIKELKQ